MPRLARTSLAAALAVVVVTAAGCAGSGESGQNVADEVCDRLLYERWGPPTSREDFEHWVGVYDEALEDALVSLDHYSGNPELRGLRDAVAATRAVMSELGGVLRPVDREAVGLHGDGLEAALARVDTEALAAGAQECQARTMVTAIVPGDDLVAELEQGAQEFATGFPAACKQFTAKLDEIDTQAFDYPTQLSNSLISTIAHRDFSHALADLRSPEGQEDAFGRLIKAVAELHAFYDALSDGDSVDPLDLVELTVVMDEAMAGLGVSCPG